MTDSYISVRNIEPSEHRPITNWGAYSTLPDPLPALHFQTKNAPNVVWRPDPMGELTTLPQIPYSCIETLDPRRLRHLASRLRRSETERSGSSFFPFEHWRNVQEAKRPRVCGESSRGESSRGQIVQGAKRPGRGRNVLGAKWRGGETSSYLTGSRAHHFQNFLAAVAAGLTTFGVN